MTINKNPAFTSLGGLSRTQHLSRLAAFQGPSICPAWRPSRPQHLSRLAAFQDPSIYPAWQPFKTPAFIPLGGLSRTQHLSRLAVFQEPSICPAWRPFKPPAFVPLGAYLVQGLHKGAHYRVSDPAGITQRVRSWRFRLRAARELDEPRSELAFIKIGCFYFCQFGVINSAFITYTAVWTAYCG